MAIKMGAREIEGRRISHYLVLDRLGAGGMGEVYRAEDLRLKRLVALKFPPQSLTEGHGTGSGSALSRAEALERFRREAQAVAALNHPGICTIFEIGDFEGHPFIAMELLEGKTLRATLAEISPAPLALAQVLDLGAQIAHALEAAHRQGVIHRDLKPANLFVTTEGRAKILDFGLAKRRPLAREKAGVAGGAVADTPSAISWDLENSPTISAADRALTTPGSLLGTVAYMSPEQALGEAVDQRTDIFSLGAVLYEMVTGRRAFTGRTFPAITDAIIHHDPPPAYDVNPQTPASLTDVINKCLAKKPGDRYSSANELAHDLEALGTGSAPRRFPIGRGARKRVRRAGQFLTAVALAAVLIAVATPAFRTWIETRAQTLRQGSQGPALPGNVNLAVLPFTGAPADASLTAFGNGLADTLTARLVQLSVGRSFQVTPTSVIRGRRITALDDARREFGANLGLQIGVQRSEGIVRVSYTVMEARTGRALRGDSIAVAESDLVSAEDRVVDSAARALGLEVGSEEQRTQSFRGTRSSAAYDYYLQGTGYLEERTDAAKLDSALETLREAVKLDPQFGLAEAALGEAFWAKYESTKDTQWIDSASAACRHAVELGNAADEGHECLGVLASGRGDYAQAVTQFQLAAQLSPTSDLAYSNLAGAYLNLNRLADAEKAYQREIDLRPQYWRGYNMLGVYYLEQQEYSKARQLFEQVIALAPDSFRGYLNLSGADLNLDRPEDARKEAQRSIAIQPTTYAYSNLGTADFLLGRFDDAARSYSEAIKLDPKEYEYYGYIGDAYYYGGRRDQASDAYRKAVALGEEALKVNPKDSSVLGLLAGYRAMLGEKEKALSELDRALASGRPDKDLLFNAAEVYNQVGEKAVALEWLAKALSAGYSTYVVNHAPALNNLHNDPRYQQLLRQK
jgi:tetratricopeptide (TPR) repeat protein